MIDWIVSRQDKTARLAMKSSGKICSLGAGGLGGESGLGGED